MPEFDLRKLALFNTREEVSLCPGTKWYSRWAWVVFLFACDIRRFDFSSLRVAVVRVSRSAICINIENDVEMFGLINLTVSLMRLFGT